jgi:prophage maintenance system killer protein
MHPISEILFEAYGVLRSKGQVSFELTEDNRRALDSVVKTVNGRYFGFERFPTPPDRAVAYLCLLIKRHALTDGNKRIALLWFQTYCNATALKPLEPDFGYDALAVAIEKTRPDDLDDLMAAIRAILFP